MVTALRPLFWKSTIALVVGIASILTAQAETVTWNVKKIYGITTQGINKAVKDAQAHFKKAPNDQVVLEFDKGSYYLDANIEGNGIINLDNVKPGPEGRLVFKGQGMDKTTLVFSDNNPP